MAIQPIESASSSSAPKATAAEELDPKVITLFFATHFETALSNVDHVLKAEIICLTDLHHGNDAVDRINARAIDLLYRPSDVVLTEDHDTRVNAAAKRGELEKSGQIRYVEKPIQFGSWDDPEGKNLIQTKLLIDLFTIVEKATAKKPFTRAELEEFIAKFADFLPPADKLALFLNSIFKNPDQVNEDVLDVFLRGTVDAIYSDLRRAHVRAAQETIVVRNQSLCHTAEMELGQGASCVWIIAGQDHFLTDEKAPRQRQEAVKLFHQFLTTKKHILFLPKVQAQLQSDDPDCLYTGMGKIEQFIDIENDEIMEKIAHFESVIE